MPWCELHEGAGAKMGVGLLLGQQSPAESQQNRAGEVGGGRDEVPRSPRGFQRERKAGEATAR